MPAYGVFGIEALKGVLATLGREARKALPEVASRKLAAMAVMAFTEPGLRPTPWKPLSDATLGRAGAASKGARDARGKARAWAAKAADDERKAEGLSGKRREKALEGAGKKRAKAKEWSGKAKAAKAAAASGRAMLYDTGNMKQSILATGGRVVVSARSKKGYPYPLAHQFGSADGKHPPPRPFIPVGKDGKMTQRAERELLAGLTGELERMAKKLGK